MGDKINTETLLLSNSFSTSVHYPEFDTQSFISSLFKMINVRSDQRSSLSRSKKDQE